MQSLPSRFPIKSIVDRLADTIEREGGSSGVRFFYALLGRSNAVHTYLSPASGTRVPDDDASTVRVPGGGGWKGLLDDHQALGKPGSGLKYTEDGSAGFFALVVLQYAVR